MSATPSHRSAFHERLEWRPRPPDLNDRRFGVLLALILGTLFAGTWLVGARPLWPLLFGAVTTAAVAAGRPQWLRPVQLALLRVGHWMSALVTPLLMGLLYFVVVTPIGWLARTVGSSGLDLERSADRESYWTPHQPSGSMRKQF